MPTSGLERVVQLFGDRLLSKNRAVFEGSHNEAIILSEP